MQNGSVNINFNFKLMRGRHVITEQVLSIPAENLKNLVPVINRTSVAAAENKEPDQACLEHVAAGIMFEVERAINSDTGFPLRCHVDQLPSDVPANMHLEEDTIAHTSNSKLAS